MTSSGAESGNCCDNSNCSFNCRVGFVVSVSAILPLLSHLLNRRHRNLRREYGCSDALSGPLLDYDHRYFHCWCWCFSNYTIVTWSKDTHSKTLLRLLLTFNQAMGLRFPVGRVPMLMARRAWSRVLLLRHQPLPVPTTATTTTTTKTTAAITTSTDTFDRRVSAVRQWRARTSGKSRPMMALCLSGPTGAAGRCLSMSRARCLSALPRTQRKRQQRYVDR